MNDKKRPHYTEYAICPDANWQQICNRLREYPEQCTTIKKEINIPI